jgi:two-component system C4-dicarboxylate transport response regulator DctD
VVVDQDGKDLQTYTGVLRHMGFEVKPFSNYQEASHCLEVETLDFVFVNQGSREFEGRELVQRVLARDRSIPVVVLARCHDMGCYLEAMQLGAVDYVEKPLPPAAMEYLVTTYVQPRRTVIRRDT